MSVENPPKMRPYWHVDAKWITGLLLAFVMGLTILVFTLIQITAEEPAVDTLSMSMALIFSSKGLDDETEIAEFRRQLNADPDGGIQPMPGLRITIRASEIANLSPREVRMYVFRQLAVKLYREGPEGLTALAETPQSQESVSQGVGPFAVFTLESHQRLQQALVWLLAACVGLLIPLIFFSSRFGRLGSPGCVLFVAGLPGAILFIFIASALKPVTAPPQSEEIDQIAGYVAGNVLPPLVEIAARNHLVAVACGFLLMGAALLGSWLWQTIRKKRASKA